MKYYLASFLVIHALLTYSQGRKPFTETSPEQKHWVDSVYRKLNKKEKIAQLFFIRAHTNLGKAYEDSVASLIKRAKVGGLVFFQGGPGRQELLTRSYQSISKVPLLIAMDAEWGLGMRLDSTISYPYQMTLGAIQDNRLIYQMGQEIARDFKRLGMHLNFAPVVDINNNPRNPVINYRSFGDNKYNVALKAEAYLNGLQDEGILVSIKHFPGHGDTDVDSHNDLPKLNFTKARLDSLELYPFRELIKKGASGVMVAHMNIPALDNTKNLPSTLSRPVVTDLLKTELGFKGLAISDAMEMKGVVKYFPNGEADVRALIAGNDIIELSEDTERAIKLTREAIRKKRLSREQVRESVKKVLAAKYWAGLDSRTTLADTSDIHAMLNRPEVFALNQKLADAAVTVLRNDSLLKALNPDARTAFISVGVTEVTTFQKQLNISFPNSTNFILSKIASSSDIANIQKELRTYDQVILAIHDYRKRPQSKLDYNGQLNRFIAELPGRNIVTCLFANPYTLSALPGIEKSKTIIVNYQNSDEAQRASAKVLSGQMNASGRLPVTVSPLFKTGDGLQYMPIPEALTGNLVIK
ncbi:glycoside hydrolase family 3 protein [Desertivirga xinjiangensis]|uniref:glycoside hydrolase family 3 protein n=1 Tax=Desertivirga xinjiangensis TaxID=539206 RepID=UPI00210D6960|nr:glycoside hydrolase family 3 protein [Pedobacter xinjiangensis]